MSNAGLEETQAGKLKEIKKNREMKRIKRKFEGKDREFSISTHQF